MLTQRTIGYIKMDRSDWWHTGGENGNELVSLQAVDKNGWTPLMHAIAEGAEMILCGGCLRISN